MEKILEKIDLVLRGMDAELIRELENQPVEVLDSMIEDEDFVFPPLVLG